MNSRYVPSTNSIHESLRNTLALILAGGEGKRLQGLTQWRVKPAIPFGGKFRIIDFVLSNCVNSNIRKIGILTQYKSQSLIRHVMKGWQMLRPELDEFIECVPAQKRRREDWYCGTADAVYQNQDLIRFYNPHYVIVLAGDHIYKMDYREMLEAHITNRADATVGALQVPESQSHQFGVMNLDEHNRVLRFMEKPEVIPNGFLVNDDKVYASMGIYIFDAEFLLDLLDEDARDESSNHDFGHDIMGYLTQNHVFYAYPFKTEDNIPAYWRDVGTIDSYYDTNMELISVSPKLNLYDEDWPIHTISPHFPAAKFVFDDDHRRGYAVDSIISEGCIVSGAKICRSLLSTNVRVQDYSEITDSVILPNVRIGSDCIIRRAIIDKECDIPDGMKIGTNLKLDESRFTVTESGIVLVEPEMLGQKVHQID